MATIALHKATSSINTHCLSSRNYPSCPCRPVSAAVRTAFGSRTVRAPTLAVRAEPIEREHEHDVAQVPETSRTAPTHQDKREDLPEHLVADVSNVAGSEAQQESAADRYGSHAAAAEKAPDSEVNQEPVAGEGASAAD